MTDLFTRLAHVLEQGGGFFCEMYWHYAECSSCAGQVEIDPKLESDLAASQARAEKLTKLEWRARQALADEGEGAKDAGPD